jgi:hypothetical protein
MILDSYKIEHDKKTKEINVSFGFLCDSICPIWDICVYAIPKI